MGELLEKRVASLEKKSSVEMRRSLNLWEMMGYSSGLVAFSS